MYGPGSDSKNPVRVDKQSNQYIIKTAQTIYRHLSSFHLLINIETLYVDDDIEAQEQGEAVYFARRLLQLYKTLCQARKQNNYLKVWAT